MTIKHHLTENLLMGYAAGTLPEAFSLVVASHVSMCDTCRAALESYEALGGAVLEERGVALSDTGLADCLARLDDAPAPARPRPVAPSGTLPAPLRDYVGGDVDAIRWRPVGGGVKQAILAAREIDTRLARIPLDMTQLKAAGFNGGSGHFRIAFTETRGNGPRTEASYVVPTHP